MLDQWAVAGIEGELIANARELATVIPVPGTDRFLLLMDTKMIDATGEDSVNDWKTGELQHGIAWLCPATSGQFLPQWLGFDELGAVNFRKGCYPGQEIVARTKYLGKVKRHPRLLNVAGNQRPKAMEKVRLSGDGQFDDAVVVDSVQDGQANWLFVVTRLTQACATI